MTVVSIPKKFLDDHVERDLPCPDILSETVRHYRIDTDHANFAELVSDARYYAEDGNDADRWVVSAARNLLASLEMQTVLPPRDPPLRPR